MKFTTKFDRVPAKEYNTISLNYLGLEAKNLNCKIECGEVVSNAVELLLKKYPSARVVGLVSCGDLHDAFIKISNNLYILIKEDDAAIYCTHINLGRAKLVAKFVKDELEVKDLLGDDEPKINLLIKDSYGNLGLRKIALKLSPIDMLAHYNDDFEDFSNKTIEALNSDKAGIVLLHGEPGTGKTTFIRNLTKSIHKKFIFLPPSFGELLTDPSFVPFLMSHRDSVIVMEDAENVIKERNLEKNHSQISNVLNLTDGMVGDYLQSKIIFTFNCDVEKIDSAILRKGRCLAQYEFKKLSADKANKLAKVAGLSKTFKDPITLAEIFND